MHTSTLNNTATCQKVNDSARAIREALRDSGVGVLDAVSPLAIDKGLEVLGDLVHQARAGFKGTPRHVRGNRRPAARPTGRPGRPRQ